MCARLQVVPLSLSPSCATQKNPAKNGRVKTWGWEARASFFFRGFLSRHARRTNRKRDTLSLSVSNQASCFSFGLQCLQNARKCMPLLNRKQNGVQPKPSAKMTWRLGVEYPIPWLCQVYTCAQSFLSLFSKRFYNTAFQRLIKVLLNSCSVPCLGSLNPLHFVQKYN